MQKISNGNTNHQNGIDETPGTFHFNDAELEAWKRKNVSDVWKLKTDILLEKTPVLYTVGLQATFFEDAQGSKKKNQFQFFLDTFEGVFSTFHDQNFEYCSVA